MPGVRVPRIHSSSIHISPSLSHQQPECNDMAKVFRTSFFVMFLLHLLRCSFKSNMNLQTHTVAQFACKGKGHPATGRCGSRGSG